MKLRNLFQRKAELRFWRRISDDHVLSGLNTTPIVKNNHYFVIRLTQMYTKDARVLWQKYHPMLHGLIDHHGDETHAIVGPQQLQGFGGGDGTKFASFNQRLVGPKPYRGGDVEILTGLYSVPGEEYASLVLGTLSTLSGLVGSVKVVEQVATMIGETVAGILRLNTTRLHVGIYDALKGPGQIKPGFYVGLDRPDDPNLLRSLWLQDGRLMKGSNPKDLQAFDETDFMIIELEPRDHYDEWRKLPEMSRYEAEFNAILVSAQSDDEKRTALDAVFRKFEAHLATEDALTDPDRKHIESSFFAALDERLKNANRFSSRARDAVTETKGVTGVPPAEGFNLLDVEMISAGSRPSSRRFVQ